MKLAISGKGGVGKTTITALISRAFYEQNFDVIAIDADPDTNLSATLGFPRVGIIPIAEMKELIEERTGAKPGTLGGFFKLNPKVEDLPEKLWKNCHGIKLMVMGTMKKGGGGCVCPESYLLKNLIQHLVLSRKEVVILDMEAGVEHLGRATTKAVDRLIIIVEPGNKSVDTAFKIKELALDIDLSQIGIIGNKVRSDSDRIFLEERLKDFEILGFLPFDSTVVEADIKNLPPWEVSPEFYQEVKKIIKNLYR
ncbi:MAG: AAA family ATPase [Thermodesulfobacteriota bacterium]|nr:AAA family ATPase [Thermodesulfobacteriota bacterium]